MKSKEKVLRGQMMKNLQDISHYNQRVDGRAEWKAGFFKGKKQALAEARKEELKWINYVLKELDLTKYTKFIFEVRKKKLLKELKNEK